MSSFSVVRMACWLAVAMTVAPAAARQHRGAQALDTTGVAPAARGAVRYVVNDSDAARLHVTVRHLTANAGFQILANGVVVATLQTNRAGAGIVRLRSRPRGHAVVLGFDPRGAQIAVRDGNGQDVLSSTLPGLHHQEGVIACCVAGRHVGACAERSQEACFHMGGTVAQATSCVPSPCGQDGDAGDDVVCCMPGSAMGAFADDDHHGMNCVEHGGMGMCAMQGGTAVTAASCETDRCDPTPPPSAAAACCVAEDHGMGCHVLTPSQCASHGGTAPGAAACAVDTCVTTPPPVGATACCLTMHDDASCAILSPSACAARGGTSTTAATCAAASCGHTGGGSGGSGHGPGMGSGMNGGMGAGGGTYDGGHHDG